MKNVYLTRAAAFLPNEAVENEKMEEILGMIDNKPSRVRNLILRQNQIKTRYYARDTNGNITHSNAQLVAEAINKIFDNRISAEDIELLACGTSLPDQIMPSHASMVHGLLKNTSPLEIISPSGVCCAGMHAFKYAYMSVASGNTENAVCSGSELASPVLAAGNFTGEMKNLKSIEENPIIAFEKDFLRWMLSDGAGVALFESEPNEKVSLRIDWVESVSYANELPPCMYCGADYKGDDFVGWKAMSSKEWVDESVFTIKQNTRLLGNNVVIKGVEHIASSLKKHNVNIETDVKYVLPHISSMYFFERFRDGMLEAGLNVSDEQWFLNLTRVGNVGSASIYLMIDELFNSGKLKDGERIFLIVPESGRFSYSTALLTVVEK